MQVSGGPCSTLQLPIVWLAPRQGICVSLKGGSENTCDQERPVPKLYC